MSQNGKMPTQFLFPESIPYPFGIWVHKKESILTLFTLACKTTISSAAVMYPLEVGRISDFDVQNGVVNFRTHHNICCLPKATKDISED